MRRFLARSQRSNFSHITNILNVDDYYKTDIHWKQENLSKVVKLIVENLGKEYIQEKYNTDLKNMCLKLLKEASYIASVDELIIKFKDTEADKLARLITYGDGKIKGSKILRDIFRKD